MAATRTRNRAKAAAPVEVVEDDAFEELDDVEEVEEDTPPPTRGRKAAKAAAAPAKKDTSDELGSVWLAEYLTETVGRDFDSRSVRMLLRKAARDEEGPLAREIGEDRARYTFKGPNDPVVKYVLKLAKAPRVVRTKAAEDVEEVEDAPKPTRTRAAKKTTAPAKATPAKASTRTRRRSAATEE